MHFEGMSAVPFDVNVAYANVRLLKKKRGEIVSNVILSFWQDKITL